MPASQPNSAPDTITIVSGVPRSGTSLMMQMLEAGGLTLLTDDVREPSEDNPRGYYEYEPVKRTKTDASWVDAARGKVVKVIHLLLQHLPMDRPYRVVFMRRDLREVVASQRRMLERHGNLGAALTDKQLIDGFAKQVDGVASWIDSRRNVRRLDVDYNELMRDPAAGVEWIDRFFGGGLDTEAMAAVVDQALYRQRSTTLGLIGLVGLGALLDGALDPAGGEQLAYIGPGAGIVLIGSFLSVLSALMSAIFWTVTWPVRVMWRGLRGRGAFKRAKVKRVVILGLDGLSPEITERLLDEGRLPNLARLREEGSYTRLGTTYPPLSPVAWSSFSTGTNPGKHNIFDFIARNPRTYRPIQSSVRIAKPRRSIRIGPYTMPIGKPRIMGLRRSKPVWSVLGEQGIGSAILRVPITFPPDRFRGVQLSAMCVPDLRGTHGTFSFYTEDRARDRTLDPGGDGGDRGGEVIPVTRRGDTVESYLVGPENTLRDGEPELRIPFRVTRRGDGGIRLRIDGQTVPLEPDRDSDWVSVRFRPAPGLKVRGVCRFRLESFEPFEMYCTPVQIDPSRPVMPISHPRVFSIYLSKLLGTYSTLGLAEDTGALSDGRIGEEAFLEQAYGIHEEREGMFFDALRRVRRGLVVCVFDGPDRIQHMFWRYIDDRHPAVTPDERPKHERVIDEMYEKMDDLVGRTLEKIDDDTAVFVMSDHGFASFRRCVDLNCWLVNNGYLVLREGATRPGRGYLADVDWSRTRAYALGLAGLMLNRTGRERHGIVASADADDLVREIAAKLTGLRDPETGDVAIREAVPGTEVYRGPYVDAAPDVIVGYDLGYRVSWDSAVGKCAGTVFSDNRKAWSGDHCIHPALVPGILFSNQRLRDDGADITDMAPTALDLLGVRKATHMDGRSLLCAG